jgi:chemotaxis protein CheD
MDDPERWLTLARAPGLHAGQLQDWLTLGASPADLPAEPPAALAATTAVDEHYGVYLMELLVNQMLGMGARKSRLKAHLYGGANVNRNMMRIGTANAEFAQAFLRREGIIVMREDMGGTNARRVDFRPASGQIRCRTVEDRLAPPVTPTARPDRASGDVELF